MTQHNKSRKNTTVSRTKKSTSHRFWLVATVILAVVIVFVVIKITGSSSVNAPAANVANTTTNAVVVATQSIGAPKIVVVQDTFDLGDLKLGSFVKTVFRIQNVGDQPLSILNNPIVKVIVGCCPPQAVLSSKIIPPGQEATITLDFMMHEGMGGKHRFNIDVQTNDPAQPMKQLVVFSNWI